MKLGMIAVAAALYVLSPLDAIPDVIVLIGWVDDIGAMLIGAASLLKMWRAAPEPVPALARPPRID